MKLNKTLVAAVLKAYHEYWDAYLKGDMQTMSYWLHDKVQMIGSGRGEFFDNKKKTIQYYKSTAKQVACKTDMRNRKITVRPVGNEILVNEECDFFVLKDSVWTFYGEGHISTLFTKNNKGWKIIQEHGSMPVANTSKGQQVNINKIKAENIRLKEAVNRRTIELEEKNSELEIETSLERVRTVAMAMKQPGDMLSVCKTISQQLQKLGVKEIRNIQTAIFYEERSSYMNYQFYAKHKKTFITDTVYTDHKVQKAFAAQMLKGKGKFYITHIKGEKKLNDFIAYQKSTNVFIDKYLYTASSLSYYWYSLGPVALGISTYLPLTVEDENLFKRFLSVFELTYRRYLDIEKAEAQTREAKIEAALEKIRSRSLAMHHSSELKEVIAVVFENLNELKVTLGSVAIWLFEKQTMDSVFWVTTDLQHPEKINLPYDKNLMKAATMYKDSWQAWHSGKSYYNKKYNKQQKDKYFKYVFSNNDLKTIPQAARDLILKAKDHYGSLIVEKNAAIFFDSWNGFTYDEQSIAVFQRAAKVFEQAYIRFLDLQKAEAQTREAQIEAALERVRSRSMAMHKSDELKEVIRVVLEQFVHLKIKAEHAGFYIDYKVHDDMHIWLADPNIEPFFAILPYFDTPTWNSFLDAKAKGKILHTDLLNFKEKNKFYKSLFKLFTVPEEAKKFYMECKGLAVSTVLLDTVGLYIENFEGIPYSDEENEVLMRFGKVFQQTYTRFLDLQKAEAQAREAQIEAALERVRARTMAMHRSDELLPTADILFDQLRQLGAELQGVAFAICDKNSHIVQKWTSIGIFSHPYNIDPGEEHMYEAWNKGEGYYEEVYEGEKQQRYYKAFMKIPEFKQGIQKFIDAGYPIPAWQKNHAITFKYGYLMVITTKPFGETQIFIRFGKVFEQTYTRFLDLQKAETQAREAKIETSLEKVRVVALAMKKSNEMLDIAQVLYEQLFELGFSNIRNAIIDIHNSSNETFMDYDYSPEMGRTATLMSYYDHPFIEKQVRQTEMSNDAFFELVLEGKDLQDLIDIRLKNGEEEDPRLRKIEQLTYNLYSFGHGSIGISNFGLLTDDHKSVLKRFRNVFAFAYQRYADMAQSEAQAREARIEIALEKVRSRTLAMQHSEELSETSAVLFHQLISLGISPNRLYICIVNGDNGDAEFWITDEDGSKVSMAYKDNLNNNPSFKKMFDGWHQQVKSQVIDLKDEELQQYFKYLNSIHVPFKGGLAQKRRIQYLAYFSKGFIGMASPDEQPEETIQLLERFAGVFNLTFTRFNDLKQAEVHALQTEQDLIEIKAARKRAEEALTELQATQKQLIQSEKMASLGELTAGIAHEIQNPLNFVNNFSEVNFELISELVVEVDKGNTKEAKALANDIKENSEKINYHGKRAGDIVKGMLQHSRKSEGKKEPTDINALCDEYLRLAYHGLRAKDKTFNAEMKTDFDETIGNINVVPQDIGRVILNLITNAFYAVNEKKKTAYEKYQPLVSIQTKNSGDKIEISVSDNGNGIPKSIVDKIFQPFFTTKPAGSGTGLGLSLSYDIIKAHGGEIKVETLPTEAAKHAGVEGSGLPAEATTQDGRKAVGLPAGQSGTAFIIQLPV